MDELITQEEIISRIVMIRGRKVMLDRDLADLYGVETRVLNQAVNRNKARFPDDFMFQLTRAEFKILMSHFVISNRGGTRKYPYAFTEQGVAMLSSVLRSERAILVNIQIMRTFTKIRQIILSNEDLRKKIEEMESRYDEQFRVVFDAIKELLRIEPETKKNRIGFGLKE